MGTENVGDNRAQCDPKTGVGSDPEQWTGYLHVIEDECDQICAGIEEICVEIPDVYTIR